MTGLDFGASDGLSGGEGAISSQVAVRGGDGRIWFLRRNGLVMVNPALLPRDGPGPQPIVDFVDNDGLPAPKDDANEVTLLAGPVRFRFSAANLRHPERTRLQYRLSGSDLGIPNLMGKPSMRHFVQGPMNSRFAPGTMPPAGETNRRRL